MKMRQAIAIKEDRRLTTETREKLRAALDMALFQMASCGIKPGRISGVSVNFRAKRWGICKLDRLTGTCSIEISSRLLAPDTPYKSLLETVLHELCHTIRGGAGHTGAWKRAVTILNQTYGYNIKRVNSAEEKGVDESEDENSYRYELQCEKCGQVFRRRKRCPLVEHPERYRCRCGGRIMLKTSSPGL